MVRIRIASVLGLCSDPSLTLDVARHRAPRDALIVQENRRDAAAPGERI